MFHFWVGYLSGLYGSHFSFQGSGGVRGPELTLCGDWHNSCAVLPVKCEPVLGDVRQCCSTCVLFCFYVVHVEWSARMSFITPSRTITTKMDWHDWQRNVQCRCENGEIEVHASRRSELRWCRCAGCDSSASSKAYKKCLAEERKWVLCSATWWSHIVCGAAKVKCNCELLCSAGR